VDDLIRAARQAQGGRIAILQFHGVPDTAHNWVSSSQQNFEAYLRYLKLEKYRVTALRDLRKYVRTEDWPADPTAIMKKRTGGSEQWGEWSVFGLAIRGCEFRVFRVCAASLFGCMDSMIGPVICGRLGSREAAKPRREMQGGCCGVW
jgi:hypothetical protein